MSFAAKSGCPMCGIVTAAAEGQTASSKAEVIWKDENFTAYRETVSPVSSVAHVIIAFNLHVPSIYTLSSTDLPLLVNLRNLAHRLLGQYISTPSQAYPPSPISPHASTSALEPQDGQFRIGFITPPFSDNKIPVKDHLHAHAYIAPADLLGWWRGVSYGPLAWYSIEDLIAEIRESVSNNRIKSGYHQRVAPIDRVPDAGARSGTANGVDVSIPAVGSPEIDMEAGEGSPHLPPAPSPYLSSPSEPSSPAAGPSSPLPTFPPQAQIPEIRV